MIARMEQARLWWRGLSDRERWMLAGLGLVLGLVVFWYGLTLPLVRMADAAERRYATAAAALAEARALAAPASRAVSADPGRAVAAAAEAAGVGIVRQAAEADGGLSIWVETPAGPLFAMLAALQREGVGVSSFEAHQSESGRIEARVTFAAAPP